MGGAAIEGEGVDAHLVHFGGQFLWELGGVGVVETVNVLGDPGGARRGSLGAKGEGGDGAGGQQNAKAVDDGGHS